MQYRLSIFPHTPAPDASAATNQFLQLTRGVIATLLAANTPVAFSETVNLYQDHLYQLCASNHNPHHHMAWSLIKLAEFNAVEIVDNNGIPLPQSTMPQELRFSWDEQPSTPAQHLCMDQYGRLLAGPLRVFQGLTLHQLTISCLTCVYTAPEIIPPEGVTEAVVAHYALELAQHGLIRMEFAPRSERVVINNDSDHTHFA